MSIPKIPSNLCRCVHVCKTTGYAQTRPHLGILTSSVSTVIQLPGTAGQLHNYHLLEPSFDVAPQTTMPSLPSSLTGTHRVLITKAITICIQTPVSQTVG